MEVEMEGWSGPEVRGLAGTEPGQSVHVEESEPLLDLATILFSFNSPSTLLLSLASFDDSASSASISPSFSFSLFSHPFFLLVSTISLFLRKLMKLSQK
jgi:hypothetical protein